MADIEPNPGGNLPPLSEILGLGFPSSGRFLCRGPVLIPNEQVEYDPAGHLRALIDELNARDL